MKVTQQVEATAEIITVMSLRKGDVYKRLEERTYGADVVWFGVVTEVAHNGEKAFINVVEFNPMSGDGEAIRQVFGGDRDVLIFPTDPADFTAAAQSAKSAQARNLNTLEQKVESFKATIALLEYALGDDLTAPVQTSVPTEVDA